MKKFAQILILFMSLMYIQAANLNEVKQHDVINLSQTKSDTK